MTTPSSHIKDLRKWFGLGFVVSAIPTILIVVDSQFHNINPPTNTTLDLVISILTLLTSCTTLLGFIFTTVITWRKEKREKSSSEIELETKKLELEKLRLELDISKRSNNSPAKRNKR